MCQLYHFSNEALHPTVIEAPGAVSQFIVNCVDVILLGHTDFAKPVLVSIDNLIVNTIKGLNY